MRRSCGRWRLCVGANGTGDRFKGNLSSVFWLWPLPAVRLVQ